MARRTNTGTDVRQRSSSASSLRVGMSLGEVSSLFICPRITSLEAGKGKRLFGQSHKSAPDVSMAWFLL